MVLVVFVGCDKDEGVSPSGNYAPSEEALVGEWYIDTCSVDYFSGMEVNEDGTLTLVGDPLTYQWSYGDGIIKAVATYPKPENNAPDSNQYKRRTVRMAIGGFERVNDEEMGLSGVYMTLQGYLTESHLSTIDSACSFFALMHRDLRDEDFPEEEGGDDEGGDDDEGGEDDEGGDI